MTRHAQSHIAAGMPRESLRCRLQRGTLRKSLVPRVGAACRCPGSCPRGLGSRSTGLPLQNGSSLLHRQAAKALLRPWNESGLGRADRPAQSATDSVPAGRANRQVGADAQCRRLSFVGWSLRICFSFKAGQWVAPCASWQALAVAGGLTAGRAPPARPIGVWMIPRVSRCSNARVISSMRLHTKVRDLARRLRRVR